MKYYKINFDLERESIIIGQCENRAVVPQNEFEIGRKYSGSVECFTFSFDIEEGEDASDYLPNDNGWFVVSKKLKELIENMNTEIQFLPVLITEKQKRKEIGEYFVANVLMLVDALCLEKSDYFETEIDQIGTIYTVSKFAIFEEKTNGADIFKLANRQEIPLFSSERFKQAVEKNNITGFCFREIRVI